MSIYYRKYLKKYSFICIKKQNKTIKSDDKRSLTIKSDKKTYFWGMHSESLHENTKFKELQKISKILSFYMNKNTEKVI